MQWDQKRKYKVDQMRQNKESEALDGCTFKPVTTVNQSMINATQSTQPQTKQTMCSKTRIFQNGQDSVTNFAQICNQGESKETIRTIIEPKIEN